MDITSIMDDLKQRMNGAVLSFKHELATLRMGRASVNLLEPLTVKAYDSVVPITQVANISVLEPRMLSVSVWDKALVKAVEYAIRDSGLGLNPITDGTNLRIPLPELNEERRKELVKIAHHYAEQARVATRHVRRHGMDHLKKLEKEGEVSRDEVHSLSEKIQKLTDSVIADIDTILTTKEAEIMRI